MNDPPEGTPAAWFHDRLAKAAAPPRDSAGVHAADRLREDLAIDSLAFIELMVDFEETFGVRLNERDLLADRYDTVQDLITHIGNELGTN
jgi:acyl carrier protein